MISPLSLSNLKSGALNPLRGAEVEPVVVLLYGIVLIQIQAAPKTKIAKEKYVQGVDIVEVIFCIRVLLLSSVLNLR